MSSLPVYPGDFPDPFVCFSAGTYYAYGTNARNVNVQVLSSPDLITWTPLGDALPSLPSWVRPGFTWSPAVLPIDDVFVLYYTARVINTGRQGISLAVSEQAQGPFRDISSAPLLFQRDLGGSIDPNPFVDSDGTAYLFWKADSNAINQPSGLWGAALAPDGQSLAGAPTKLLGFDATWENPLIEAPAVVVDNGSYYLFYSANWYASAGYAVGYAVASSVLGPYRKVTTTGPWFAADANVAGPGGQAFFVDAGGATRMAYHGWTPGEVGYPGNARSLRLGTVAFQNGVPKLSW